MCPAEQDALNTFAKEFHVNKIIAALVAATFSLGAFAQAASAPATEGKPAAAKAEKKAKAKKAKAAKASKKAASAA